MRTLGLSFLCLLTALLSACESGIRRVPRGVPRLEVEVVYDLDESFYSEFADPVDRALLERVVRDAVEPWTDLGLRFYAVPSDLYGPTQRRPEHVMSVRAVSLECSHRMQEIEQPAASGVDPDQPPLPKQVEAVLTDVGCDLEIRVERRREDAPRLTIARAETRGRANPSANDDSAAFALRRVGDEVNQTEVRAAAVFRAVEAAAKRAFVELLPAIDRELDILSGGTESGAAGSSGQE